MNWTTGLIDQSDLSQTKASDSVYHVRVLYFIHMKSFPSLHCVSEFLSKTLIATLIINRLCGYGGGVRCVLYYTLCICLCVHCAHLKSTILCIVIICIAMVYLSLSLICVDMYLLTCVCVSYVSYIYPLSHIIAILLSLFLVLSYYHCFLINTYSLHYMHIICSISGFPILMVCVFIVSTYCVHP